jgi:hypothetical protein
MISWKRTVIIGEEDIGTVDLAADSTTSSYKKASGPGQHPLRAVEESDRHSII